MLFDVGDIKRNQNGLSNSLFKVSPQLPNDSLTTVQTIVNYLRQVHPAIKHIDYLVLSHFHDDHYGAIHSGSPVSKNGYYRLSGATEVPEYIPVRKIIDRDYPNYNYPVDIRKHHFDTTTFSNYLRFVATQQKKGTVVESLVAGSKHQIVPTYDPHSYPSFSVQNMKANGHVWIGSGDVSKDLLPKNISVADYNENHLSLAVKISYGAFDYFTGGDMTGATAGLPTWYDMETPVAKVVGSVEALSLNHHGVRDATSAEWLKILNPQVIVQQSWSSNHPGEEVMHRLTARKSKAKDWDIFATYIHDETRYTYGRSLADNYESIRGHVVIRVKPGGDTYSVFVLDDQQRKLTLLKEFGPYVSR